MMIIKETLTVTLLAMIFIITYAFNKYHVINNLIICEYVVITLLMIMFNVNLMMQMENYLILFVLVILITESVLGLSLMVNLIRTYSNDFMKSMTTIKF